MGKVLKGWHSGQVVRKHTMMNLRAENIAEHTWGVLHVMLSVFSEVSSRQLIHALYHDFGERATGDIPGPVRWANKDIADACDMLELKYIQENLAPQLAAIMAGGQNQREFLMMEFADRIEFCFSMFREYRMGNQYAIKPWRRSRDKAKAAWDNLQNVDTRAAEDIAEWWPEMEEIEKEMWG